MFGGDGGWGGGVGGGVLLNLPAVEYKYSYLIVT